MSVDELSLAELNYPKALLMRTAVPGPQAQSWLARALLEVESMARGAGRFPLVFAEAAARRSWTRTATCSSTWPPVSQSARSVGCTRG